MREMVRFKIGVSYIGTPYAGFTKALDSRLPSVQARLESALSSFLGSEANLGGRGGSFRNFQVSSRTDAGVHAIRNVFHVDCLRANGHSDYSAEGVVDGLNYYLGKQMALGTDASGASWETGDSFDERSEFETIRLSYRNKATLRSIVVTDATPVSDTFDARLDAKARTYEYNIIAPTFSFHKRRQSRRSDDLSVFSMDCLVSQRYMFYQHRAWCLPFPVDVGSMREAASHLIGEHDFSTFRNSGCQSSSPVRRLSDLRMSSRKLVTHPGDDATAPTGLWPDLILPSSSSSSSSQGVSAGEGAEGSESSSSDGADTQLITISVTADSFLLRMVRNICGALVHVGRSKYRQPQEGDPVHPHDMSKMLAWRQRSMLKIKPAPAEGLYLRNVKY